MTSRRLFPRSAIAFQIPLVFTLWLVGTISGTSANADGILVPAYRMVDHANDLLIGEVPKSTLPPPYESGWVKGVTVAPKDLKLVGQCGTKSKVAAWQTKIKYQVFPTADLPVSATQNLVVRANGKDMTYSRDTVFSATKSAGLCYLEVHNNLMVSTEWANGATPTARYDYDYRLACSLYSFSASGIPLKDFVFRDCPVKTEAKMGLYAPAPSRLGFPLTMPDVPVLEFYYGMIQERELGSSDGARYSVLWKPKNGEPLELWADSLSPSQKKKDPFSWYFVHLDLKQLAGQEGTLIFSTFPNKTPGPPEADSSESPSRFFDYCCWGQPTIYAAAPPDKKKTNLVLIVCDAMRGDRLGYVGYARKDISPNIDSLTTRGIAYLNCFSAAPWTPPSFTSIFSGCAPRAHGVTGYGGIRIPPRLKTLTEILYSQGYATFGVSSNGNTSRAFGLNRGFETYVYPGEGDQNAVNKAIPFLKQNKDRASFVFLHFNSTHRDYAGDKAFRYKYLPSVPEVDPLKIALKLVPEAIIKSASPEAVKQDVRAIYDGSVCYEDFQIGRLIATLKELQLLDNTLIVVTADHGEELWDRGEFGHGHSLQNVLLHVPLVFSHPEIPSRRVVEFVHSKNIAPTVLAFLGIDKKLWNQTASGRDLEIRSVHPEETQVGTREDFVSSVRDQDALYSGTMKLLCRRNAPAALYDLSKDFNEKNDLLKSQPEQVKTLKARLDQLLKISEENQKQLVNGAPVQKVILDEATSKELKGIGYLK